MSANVTPWWEVLAIRSEIARASGSIDDVQMSLFRAVYGNPGDRPPYAEADYYGEITHPSSQFLDLLAAVATRLAGGSAYTGAPALWRLDQAMGGGKSHGLIGLFHLAAHPSDFRTTDVGEQALQRAERAVGTMASHLGDPQVVVLACDNITAGRPKTEVDGPAVSLAERFFWHLFGGDLALYRRYKDDFADKSRLVDALTAVGRPVLILVDEIMDYIRQLSDSTHADLAVKDMAFLRALLDVVNDVPNVAMVIVMIASENDNMDLDSAGQQRRGELDQLLVRNGQPATINDAGDFAAILRRRLFERTPPGEVVTATAALYAQHMGGQWGAKVFDVLNAQWVGEWEREVSRCYPFHPQLIALAEQEWAKLAGFQRVRSTIRIFAATAYALAKRGGFGEWTPLLIGPGDLPLSDTTVREAIIGSGLIMDSKTQANYRQVASTDIVGPDDRTGSARLLDRERSDPVTGDANPRAAERAATLLFLTSIVGSRGGGRQGATETEVKASSFVPSANFGMSDADSLIRELTDVEGKGLASLEVLAGKGGQAARLYLSTRQTLNMLVRAARGTVNDEERDEQMWNIAQGVTTTGPFHAKVFVTAVPGRSAFNVLADASFDDARSTRLIVLDPRQFILLNGIDKETRGAVRAAMGLGPDKLSVGWAASAVFAVANTRGRSLARSTAAQFIAWDRVANMPDVRTDQQLSEKAMSERAEALRNLQRHVRRAFQHVIYLDIGDEDESRTETGIQFDQENQTALDGTTVWAALVQAERAVGVGAFSANALVHNLSEQDIGRPLDELRDLFWSTPRFPLLPSGNSDLQQAIFQAVAAGQLRLVGADGVERHVSRPNEIGVGQAGLRLARPRVADIEGDENSSDQTTEDLGSNRTDDGTGDGTKDHELELSFSLRANLTNEERRDAVRDLLMTLADRIDEGETSYGEIMVKMVLSTSASGELMEKVTAAGGAPSVRGA